MSGAVPAVSVIMPVHNGEQFLLEATESILNQTFLDFELVVIDDASSDNSLAILCSLKNPRIRVLRNATRQGVTVSLNRAARASRADLIARMDADDVAHPERLKHQVAYIRANPDVGALGTRAWVVGPTGRVIWKSRGYANSHATRWQLCFGTPFVHSTVMLRRAALERSGGYDERLPFAQDYDLWLRIADDFEIANLPEPLLDLRIHGASVSQQRAAQQEAIAGATMRKALERCLGAPVSELDVAAISNSGRGRAGISDDDLLRVIRLVGSTLAASLSRASRTADRRALRLAAADQLVDIAMRYGRARPRTGLLALTEAWRCWPPAMVARTVDGLRTYRAIQARRLSV